jgi:hypothetical protein
LNILILTENLPFLTLHEFILDLCEGQRHGHGRLEYNNGDLFYGDFRNDCKQGKGVYIWSDGRTYEGEIQQQQRQKQQQQ